MKLTRQQLIEQCDKFLNDQIGKEQIQNFAWNAITEDDYEWDNDEILSETIFEWDNEGINFEINKTNILLWKKRLLTNENQLPDYNLWNSHIERQKDICKQNNSDWKPINKQLMIGISADLLANPINGLRHPSEKGTTGWFIWTGEYSINDDFFKPMCAEHLLQERPEIIKYLGLDIGYRLLMDSEGYEDIWFDETLKTFNI